MSSNEVSIGVIYPPPELRTVVDTAAQYVAKNGEEFEKKILKNEGSKTKFGFVLKENPYHSYYKMRIEDFTKNPNLEISKPKKTVTITKKPTVVQRNRPKKDPIVYQYGVQVPEGMKPFEFDIIKLTAQFVARNGRPFLSALAGRESRNAQFDFLKVQHRFFSFFTKLTEIYKRILIPPNSTLEDLVQFSSNKLQLLQLIYSKSEWENYLIELKNEKNDQIEVVNDIDWNDFVLVEKIDFTMEDFISILPPPPPLTTNTPSSSSSFETVNPIQNLIENTFKEQKSESESDQDEDMDMDEDEDIKIKKNYVKKKQTIKKKEEYFKDQNTGELIPIDRVNEHLRVKLINPKWSEQKEKENEKFKTTNIAADNEMTQSIADFAKKRKNQEEEEEVTEVQQWDGKKSTIEKMRNRTEGGEESQRKKKK
jgi:splicing factor 3A subunit 1